MSSGVKSKRISGTGGWLLVALAGLLGFWPGKLVAQPGDGPSGASGIATLPTAGAGSGNAAQPSLMTVARRSRRAKGKSKGKAAPVISRAQMEMAQQMVRDAEALGRRLPVEQRVALMARLLYTMRPEVMAEEKRQWAEELFALAQRLPAGDGGGAGNAAGSMRDAAIATAAARMAVYDSDRALELLDSLPSVGGNGEDPRTMAARLVFGIYVQHHGAAGAQTLLLHARKWGEHGGFPYEASAVALARLRMDETASEDFFRQTLAVFERGQEGLYGVREFAGLLDRGVALDAFSDESAEEAGRAVMAQLGRLTGIAALPVAGAAVEGAGEDSRLAASAAPSKGDAAAGASTGVANDAANDVVAAAAKVAPVAAGVVALTEEQKRQVVETLNDVRLSAPKAYAQAQKEWPGLFTLRAVAVLTPLPVLKVDAGLQASFAELAEAIRERRGLDALHEVIGRGLLLVNARYKAAGSGHAATDAAPVAGASSNATLPAAGALAPDAQSWALVSLAAYASPGTIAAQLNSIEAPFWHAYLLAIAAQQVGEPTRVADPTARRVAGKEEAEPEE